jgi:transposase
MQALPGGKAQHDQIDSHQIAVLLRGGMLPQADVSPAERRATRDLLRRRMPLTRNRAEWLAPIPQTNSQDHLPEIGKKLAYQAHRDGVAERVADPAVQKRLEVDLALIGHDDGLLTDLARDLVQTAKAHEAQTFYRVRSIPGVGQILALVLLDDIHDICRFPRVPECVSDGRLVTWAKESAGKR